MERFDDIYMINETLLDDVEVDEVSDEEDDELRKFQFELNFYKTDMDEVLESFLNEKFTTLFDKFKKRGIIESYETQYVNCDDFQIEYRGFAVRIFCKQMTYDIINRMCAIICSYAKRYSRFDNSGNAPGEYMEDVSLTVTEGFYDSNTDDFDEFLSIDQIDAHEDNDTYERKYDYYVNCTDGGFYDVVFGVDYKIAFGNLSRHFASVGLLKPIDRHNSRFVVFAPGAVKTMYVFDDKGKYIFSHTFDKVDYFLTASRAFLYDDYDFMVVLCGRAKQNYVNLNGDKLLDKDVSSCGSFKEGYGTVCIDSSKNDYNYVDVKGNFLLDFDFPVACYDFNNGKAMVRKKYYYNYVDSSGNLMMDDWYDITEKEGNEYSIVKNKDGLYNVIDRNCKFIWEGPWFKCCEFSGDTGFFIVSNDNYEQTYMDASGKLLSDIWFADVFGFPSEGVFGYKKGSDRNIYDIATKKPLFKGKEFEDMAFAVIKNRRLYSVVNGKGMQNLLSADGRFLFDKWYVVVHIVNDDFFIGNYDENGKSKYDLLTSTGDVTTCDDDFRITRVFGDDDYVTVEKTVKLETDENESNHLMAARGRNFMNKYGKFVSDKWFSSVDRMIGGFAKVNSLNDCENVVTVSGKLLLPEHNNIVIKKIDVIVPEKIAVVIDSNNKSKVFDVDGNSMIGDWSDEQITGYADGLLKIGVDGAYVDYEGKCVSLI